VATKATPFLSDKPAQEKQIDDIVGLC